MKRGEEGKCAMDNSLGNKEIMAKNIQRLMDLYGKDRSEVCKDLGISYTTFTDWVKGKTYPRIDKIEILANYFHVSKADLVEEPDVKYYGKDGTALLITYHDLNDDGRQRLLQYAEELSAIAKYQKKHEEDEDV